MAQGRIGRTARVRRGVLLLVLALAATRARADVTLRVGLYQNNPKIFLDASGHPAGFFVDVLAAIARTEHWKLVYVNGTWADGLAALAQGRIDLMPDVAQSIDREGRFAFCGESVLSTWSQVWAGRGVSIRSILDLDGKRIAVLNDSTQQTALASLARQCDLKMTLVSCSTYDDAFGAVEGGRADAVIANRFYGVANQGRFRVVETTVLLDPASLHFATRKNQHGDWLAAIDRDLVAMKADPDSAYHVALDRWLGTRRAFRLPALMAWIAAVGAGALLLALAFVAALQWQLHRRTAQLVRAQEAALRMERMHTLSAMAGGIAHDLNNVLAPIMGQVEILLADPKALGNEATLRQGLETISSAAWNVAAMVKRLRIFYDERWPQEPEPVDLGALLNDLEDLAKPMLKVAPGIRVTLVRSGATAPPVVANRGELRDALLAVIHNAIEAMPQGGLLRLALGAADGRVTILIEDSGIGMDAATLANCQQPFFTTKGAAGTGMGLAAVRHAVERHGGTLTLASDPDHGTRVTIDFPVARP